MLTEALLDALGRVAADCKREWMAEARATIAEQRADYAALKLAMVQQQQDFVNAFRLLKESVRDGAPGKDGKDGIDGKDGAPGKDGTNGIDGAPGERGADGANGADGRAGADGNNGKDGAAGLDGLPGAPGKDGAPGIDGRNGLDGEPGKDGTLPIVKQWAKGVHYRGHVVTHDGAAYQALNDTADTPGASDDWICLAARGTDGKGFRICGTYDAGLDGAYKANDVVAFNGGSFVAKIDNPGACPGADWQLIASPGKRGKEGPPGERGLKGASIEAPAPLAIVGWRTDKRSYSAVPIMSDGKDGPAINLRGMFEQFQIEAT